MTKRLRMMEIFQQMMSDNIMSDLAGFNTPWATDTTINQTYLDYGYYSNSANKLAAPIVTDLLNDDGSISENNRTILAGIIFTMFNQKWKHLWTINGVEYNPIQNYDMTETESIDTDTTDNTTNTGTITNVTDSDSTQTGTVADNGNTSENVGVYGFNSDSSVGTDTSTGTVTNTRTDNLSGTNDTTETETRNTATSNIGNRAVDRELRRSGNIGVTTSQQMIESEIELWKWNFFKSVFADIDSVCCLDVY